MARGPRKLDWTAIILMSPSVAIFLGLLVMPILVVLVLSFGERAEAGGYQAAFTFAQYVNLPARWAAFRNTLILAPIGTAHLPAGRLSAGLFPRGEGQPAAAAAAAHPGHRAVLDQLPHPHLCLDLHPGRQGHSASCSD